MTARLLRTFGFWTAVIHAIPEQEGETILSIHGYGRQPGGGAAPRQPRSSYDFSIKWLTPFYPANSSQAAGSGEKCMDLRFFLRLRRWLLKQQPNKTVFNRFIEKLVSGQAYGHFGSQTMKIEKGMCRTVHTLSLIVFPEALPAGRGIQSHNRGRCRGGGGGVRD